MWILLASLNQMYFSAPENYMLWVDGKLTEDQMKVEIVEMMDKCAPNMLESIWHTQHLTWDQSS